MTADLLESLDPPLQASEASVRPVKNAPAHDTSILELGRGGTNFSLPATSSAAPAARRNPSLVEAVATLERRTIEDALNTSQGNLARAARALGTTERILRYKVEKYGLLAAVRAAPHGQGGERTAPGPGVRRSQRER